MKIYSETFCDKVLYWKSNQHDKQNRDSKKKKKNRGKELNCHLLEDDDTVLFTLIK